MRIAVIDVETTGDSDDDVAVEAAIVVINHRGILRQWNSLISPGDRAISPVASACHHLTSDIIASQNAIVSPNDKFWQMLVKDCTYIASHNAAFDSRYLPAIKQPWICTYRCALSLYPLAPKHSLQCLRYWLSLKPAIPAGLTPHRALYDAICCATLLQQMLKKHRAQDLLDITQAPLLLHQVKFGKHRGDMWADVPKTYLKWLLKKDFDEDVKHTAIHYLKEQS